MPTRRVHYQITCSITVPTSLSYESGCGLFAQGRLYSGYYTGLHGLRVAVLAMWVVLTSVTDYSLISDTAAVLSAHAQCSVVSRRAAHVRKLKTKPLVILRSAQPPKPQHYSKTALDSDGDERNSVGTVKMRIMNWNEERRDKQADTDVANDNLWRSED